MLWLVLLASHPLADDSSTPLAKASALPAPQRRDSPAADTTAALSCAAAAAAAALAHAAAAAALARARRRRRRPLQSFFGARAFAQPLSFDLSSVTDTCTDGTQEDSCKVTLKIEECVPYNDSMCLTIDKPFLTAFICGQCLNNVHGQADYSSCIKIGGLQMETDKPYVKFLTTPNGIMLTPPGATTATRTVNARHLPKRTRILRPSSSRSGRASSLSSRPRSTPPTQLPMLPACVCLSSEERPHSAPSATTNKIAVHVSWIEDNIDWLRQDR